MKGRTSVVLAALMFAVTLMLVTTPALAQGLPEGVSVKVLAVFPSPLPGIEKVRLLEVALEPGAKWEGFVQKNTSY